jgi:hypothetical protein
MNQAPRSAFRTIVLPVTLGVVAPLALLWGCKKEEEPPPPLPSAAPASTPAPPLELTPEDAGKGDADADAAKPKTGTGKPGASLSACCSALMQNSKSAPPPQNMYMMQAAGVCQALVAQGKEKASIVGAVSGALKGAGMPAACR